MKDDALTRRDNLGTAERETPHPPSGRSAHPPGTAERYIARTEQLMGVLQTVFGVDAVGDDATDAFVIAETFLAELHAFRQSIEALCTRWDQRIVDGRIRQRTGEDELAACAAELRAVLTVPEDARC